MACLISDFTLGSKGQDAQGSKKPLVKLNGLSVHYNNPKTLQMDPDLFIEGLGKTIIFFLGEKHTSSKMREINGAFLSNLALHYKVTLFLEGLSHHDVDAIELLSTPLKHKFKINPAIQHNVQVSGWDLSYQNPLWAKSTQCSVFQEECAQVGLSILKEIRALREKLAVLPKEYLPAIKHQMDCGNNLHSIYKEITKASDKQFSLIKKNVCKTNSIYG